MTPEEEAAAAAATEKTALETANADLEAAAAVILAGVPEHLKALIPTNMSARERIDWFAQAKATGIFDRAAVPETESGAKPTITPKAPDTASLPPYARMAAGYRK
jgi:hypothetical protein